MRSKATYLLRRRKDGPEFREEGMITELLVECDNAVTHFFRLDSLVSCHENFCSRGLACAKRVHNALTDSFSDRGLEHTLELFLFPFGCRGVSGV